MLCSLSKLDNSQLGQIESLEKELGKTLLSFTCYDIEPAELGGEELEKMKSLVVIESLTCTTVIQCIVIRNKLEGNVVTKYGFSTIFRRGKCDSTKR